jgi:hypothetical protein
MPYETAAAICADKIARVKGLLARRPRQSRVNAAVVLLEAGQLASEFDPMAQLVQPLAHDAFRQKLRNHQWQMIRLGWRRIDVLGQL